MASEVIYQFTAKVPLCTKCSKVPAPQPSMQALNRTVLIIERRPPSLDQSPRLIDTPSQTSQQAMCADDVYKRSHKLTPVAGENA